MSEETKQAKAAPGHARLRELKFRLLKNLGVGLIGREELQSREGLNPGVLATIRYGSELLRINNIHWDDDVQWEKLEERIKVNLDKDTRTALGIALSELIVNVSLQNWIHSADVKAVNKDLERITKSASTLVDIVTKQPDFAARIAVAPVLDTHTVNADKVEAADRRSDLSEKFVTTLRQIAQKAEEQRLARKPGHPKGFAEERFKDEVLRIWGEVEGARTRGAYFDLRKDEMRGEAVDIVNALCDAGDIEWATRNSIIERLRPRRNRTET